MAKNTYQLPEFKWEDDRHLIEMCEITKVFKSPAGEAVVLKGVDVEIERGEFVSVVGRSGSGKSTLVNMLTGIDHPTRGTVRIGDTYIHRLSESNMSVWRGRHLGIVFQFFQLLPMLTLLENVMLPMDFCEMYPPAEREQRALRLLERVGLAEFSHQLPGAVSGGQQQSAALARALANDPPLILADEPTGNLDSRTAEQVMQLFEELVDQGKTIVMVTHDRDLAKRGTRTMVIADGELVHPALVTVFPNLPHNQLLELTHLAQVETYEPGETIAVASSNGRSFLLPSKGILELKVATHSNGHAPQIISSGEWVDLHQLEQDMGESLAARAGGTGSLEVLVYDREKILPVLQPYLNRIGSGA
jgi:putative ABC transport system ATP-binding protein